MSFGGKYMFAVLCVLMALGMFMKVMSSLISGRSTYLFVVLCMCVWWCSGIFLVF